MCYSLALLLITLFYNTFYTYTMMCTGPCIMCNKGFCFPLHFILLFSLNMFFFFFITLKIQQNDKFT